MIDMLMPGSVLITGVEDDPDEPGLLRVYVGARGGWNYVLVSDPADQESIRSAWGSTAKHLTTRLDPDAPIYHDADGKAAAKARAEELWTDR